MLRLVGDMESLLGPAWDGETSDAERQRERARLNTKALRAYAEETRETGDRES